MGEKQENTRLLDLSILNVHTTFTEEEKEESYGILEETYNKLESKYRNSYWRQKFIVWHKHITGGESKHQSSSNDNGRSLIEFAEEKQETLMSTYFN